MKYSEIVTKITNDLTLEGEDFVVPEELLGYANEAIRKVEAEVHTINEDYFLSKLPLTLVSGTDSYDLPTNVYAHKIRRLIYQNGTTVYTIQRLKDWKKFEKQAVAAVTTSGTVYGYLLDNSISGQPQFLFSPPVKESGQFVTCWYIRTAAKFTGADDDICDIPEFINYVLQFIKVRCYEKEIGHPNLPIAKADLEDEKRQMVETLTGMVPDAENDVEADMSFYEEHT